MHDRHGDACDDVPYQVVDFVSPHPLQDGHLQQDEAKPVPAGLRRSGSGAKLIGKDEQEEKG